MDPGPGPGPGAGAGPGSRWCCWMRVWWCCWCLLASGAAVTRALELQDLFPYGPEAGDQQLQPGSDSSAEVSLNASLLLFSRTINTVHVNTNGFVAVDDPPAEGEYLGKMPSSFPMIAALLGDLDGGDGRGSVYYRQDDDPEVLDRAARHIRQAFPRDDGVEPLNALIVTWENMAAAGTSSGRGDGLDAKRNTFQLVVASMASSSCAVLLYPRNHLQFFSTTVGGQSRVLEAGFNEGTVESWFWSSKQGVYFRTTTEDESSVRELTEKTNSGQNGVWVYEIGSTPFFAAITPGQVASPPEEGKDATDTPVTMLPRQPDFTTYEPLTTMTTEAVTGEEEGDYQPSDPDAETVTPGYADPETEEPEYLDFETTTASNNGPSEAEPRHPYQTETRYPTSETFQPRYTITETTESSYSPAEPRYPDPEPAGPRYPEPAGPRYPEPAEPRYPDPEPAQPRYPNPEPVQPRYSQPHQPQIVVVDEDEDLDVNVFAYNLETCAHNRHKCSAFADCRDYNNGYCCHCRPGFYGNGKDCVAEGKPQRMNGKVNGRVFVGDSPSPVELGNQDLHSYVVADDGRAYVAISNIPDSLGPSLQPLSSMGGIIGWAFALEQPGYENGFSLIGGVFSRQAEVIFQPGNERLSIHQVFKGIDEHDHLVVNTELQGRVPRVLLGSSVQIRAYKEIYQYDRNLITSSSNREYTITSPDGIVETRSYQWRQTITFQSCPHDDAPPVAPPTQQLSVDQIFVMFDTENRLIRYAMSNRIGSVHSSVPEQNPCFTGRHGCDINAACRPGDGLSFTCTCSNGFAGDGRSCYDVDECSETPQVCGLNSVCRNQPGSFSCDCPAGFRPERDGRTCTEEERPVNHCLSGSHDCDAADRAICFYTGGSAFTCACRQGYHGDGRVCQDVDECEREPCHRDASCTNAQGSFTCQCKPGFHGDGFQCSSTEQEKTPCERHRDSVMAAAASRSGLFSFFRPRPAAAGEYVPQCDDHGAYESTQCHVSIGQCWCADANGQEIPNTRTGPGSTPLCIEQVVTPPPVGPSPRPDVHPLSPGSHLLFAQSGRIQHLPLDGYGTFNRDEAKTLLHVPDRVVIAVAFDCVEQMVYWSDITAPSISRARVNGGDVNALITSDLQSPEGVAVDSVSRLLFWTDSMKDTVEVSKLDGSDRRVLIDSDLVNPRPIVTDPAYGRIYWADWNRDAPKIEMSNMDGSDRTVLVKDDLGLPNGLTFDPDSQQLCWADAGTRRVECMDPHRRLRRMIVDGIQYPFALVSYGRNLYYTDWRREAVVAVDKRSATETEEFLPQRRSRLYGIATTTTQCPQAYNYCSNNGGCSHLCLPRLGGFTCRCPDAVTSPNAVDVNSVDVGRRCEESSP